MVEVIIFDLDGTLVDSEPLQYQAFNEVFSRYGHPATPEESAIILYAGALLHAKTRVLGIGLCVHVILDSIDCRLTNGVWYVG